MEAHKDRHSCWQILRQECIAGILVGIAVGEESRQADYTPRCCGSWCRELDRECNIDRAVGMTSLDLH